MLYPKMNQARSVIDLSGVWGFRLGTDEEPGEHIEKLEKPEVIAVPASYNDQKDDPAYRHHYGWACYQREIVVPAYMKDERRVLRFDAVTHNAKIYLNQRLVLTHKGGFLPFEIDITDLIPAGEKALLSVAVDNRVNHGTLPVGNEDVAFFGSDNPGIPSVESAKQARKNRTSRTSISSTFRESIVLSAYIRRRRLTLKTLCWFRIFPGQTESSAMRCVPAGRIRIMRLP